jgi:methyl-accepting chemotaxis protein
MMKKRPMGADGTDVERRKSRRFPVIVPLEVSWRGANGTALKEDAVAHQVNARGGFLRMSKYPEVGGRVTLVNFLSAQTAEARVLAAPDSRPGVASGIVVELVVPSESFWGIDLQVNKTIVELQNLEKAFNDDNLDVRIVREYRDAMDYICKITDTLRRLRVSKNQSSDDRELLSALAADRVRRAISVCLDVTADLDAGRIGQNSARVEELAETVEDLQQRLKQYRRKLGPSLSLQPKHVND